MDLNFCLKNHLILTCLIVFVVIYIVINYNRPSGQFLNGNMRTPILYSAVIVLALYLYCNWDDEIPVYKIGNRHIMENKSIGNTNFLGGNTNFFGGNNENDNIFISQRQANRFGIKF